MLLEQLSSISIEKIMNYMDLGGFLRFLGQDAWQPVATCGSLSHPSPVLISCLVDLAGLD